MIFTPLIGAAALLSGLAYAAPRPDSAVGEEAAVSAPNGTPITDTAELAAQTGSANNYGSSYGGSSYGSSSGGSSYDGSSGGSSYGGSSGGSSYGGSSGDSSYGGSAGGSSYGGSSGGDTGSSWSSSAIVSSSTSAPPSYSTPSYGSGSSNWGGSGYNDCVSQCIASFGAPPAAYTPTVTGGSSGSTGTGATHTVVVAPSQGVLRYIPFALNASVGDTIMFMWGANNHTVTKSSELTPCNKTGDALFASGTQNKGFAFSQVVNSTSPTFYYCGTPGHCEKGMFGIINPPSAFGTPTSVSGMMSSMVSNSSDMAAMQSWTDKACANNTQAAKWGSNIDVGKLPSWSHPLVAQNVMYTRTLLAANPDILDSTGAVRIGSNPLMIPQDVTSAINNAAAPAPNAAAAPAASTTPAAATSASAASSASVSPSAAAAKSGASSLASPSMLVGVIAAVATFFML